MPSSRKQELRLGSKRHLLVVWPFLLVVLLLVPFGNFNLALLSTMRALVNGESLWSKAQKSSVAALDRYAITRDEADYQRYLGFIAVPLGDRAARTEFDNPDPDPAVILEGFLRGRQ